MPRIKLSNWFGDKPPGTELDVDDAQLKSMRLDGRVAEVIETPAPAPDRQESGPASDRQDPELVGAEPKTGTRKR